MRLNQINLSEDAIEATSNRSIYETDFIEDISFLILRYLEAFKNDLNSLDWDHFSVEFWFDSGQLVFYPEKKNSFEYKRLEPYMYLVFEQYQLYFDSLLENNILDEKIEIESVYATNRMIQYISEALNLLSDDLFKIINKRKILFKYYGVTKEILIYEQWLEA